MEGRIEVSAEAGVAHVQLARPGKLNAMDGDFFTALGDTFCALGSDQKVRAILLSAQGKHFTAGLDLAWAASALAPSADPGRWAEKQTRFIPWLQGSINAVEEARVPVVAAIHGGCIGGGVDLACACDLRIASADAFFQAAEIDVAITADLGTLQRLPHLIPGGIARELALTGRRMDAEEAARWGLVNRIARDREAAIATGLELAHTLAAKPPLALVGTKRALNHSRGRPVEEGLREAGLWNAATLASADMATVLKAKMSRGLAEFEDLAP